MAATNVRTVNAYNAGNVIHMRTESSSADTLAAMLASCSPTMQQQNSSVPGCNPSMQVPRSVCVGSLEDAVICGGQKRSYYPGFDTSEENGEDDGGDDCTHHVEKKRRLTVDQVRSLEKNFELENKLEPDRKMQLARELGLQPRQVAVWFQNRRARWKTKQLERDYDVLKMEYDALKLDYESVIEEREKLQAEVLRLGKLQAKEKQRKLEGQLFDVDDIEIVTDLSAHLDLPQVLKSELGAPLIPEFQITTGGVFIEHTVKCKEKDGATSSESNSSEIMNADSPHPIDSGLSAEDQKATHSSQLVPTMQTTPTMDPTLIQFADDMCGKVLTPQAYHQRSAVKLEDGSFQEECNYFYPSIDENGNLPWWEWP